MQSSIAGATVIEPKKPLFSMRGVYFHDGFSAEPKSYAPLYWDFEAWKRQIDWLKACGINTIEFATMLEFNRLPKTERERKKIADKLRLLDYAHKRGMQFGYLLTNTVLSTVPDNEEPGDQLGNRAKNYCPQEPGNFEKTLTNPKFYMETFKEADFFEEFAADWGGCDCGRCGVPQFMQYVQVLAERLKEINSKASLYADTWCISYWRKDPMKDGWRGVFDNEISGSREVIQSLARMPQNVGVALPCHHLYRPLAFQQYGGKAKTPQFPIAADVQGVRASNRPLLAWTHFVMDDDAFRPAAWGIVHSEVRYLQELIRKLSHAGIDRVIGNLYLPLLQISNTFAFGRLLENPNTPPERILHDFAKLVAQKEDVARLTEVLVWLENSSYWQEQMPEDGRLPKLHSTLTKTQALEEARRVRPRERSTMPLPLPPSAWCNDLVRSIERMTWVGREEKS
jgi:hypothetical protein